MTDDTSSHDASDVPRIQRNGLFRRCVAILRFRTVWALAFVGLFVFGIPFLIDYEDHGPVADDLLILSDMAEVFQAVADSMADRPVRTTWIVDQRPARNVRMGAMESIPESHLKDLQFRGVDRNRCRVICTNAVTPHDMLRQFVADDSTRGKSFTVMVSSAQGRYWRTVIDQALTEQEASRFRIKSFTPIKMTKTGWFLNRQGGKMVQHHFLQWMFVCLAGESEYDSTDHYADVFPAGSVGP